MKQKQVLMSITQIASYSNRCVYEAESFMNDLALYGLNQWSKRSEKGWTIEDYVSQIKSRFDVDVGYMLTNKKYIKLENV